MDTILVSCDDHVLEPLNIFVLFVGDRLLPPRRAGQLGSRVTAAPQQVGDRSRAGQAAMSSSSTASSPESLYLALGTEFDST
jgi:hypothetical protein